MWEAANFRCETLGDDTSGKEGLRRGKAARRKIAADSWKILWTTAGSGYNLGSAGMHLDQ
jgi:hypothetical protein